MKEGSRGLTGSGAKLSVGKLLVVLQVSLSLLLLIGSGLFVRSLQNLQHVDLGYERDHLLLVTVDATPAGYKGQRANQLWRRLLASVSRLPGVKAAAFSDNGLFSGSESATEVEVEGFRAANDRDKGCRFDQVSPGYFEAVGIPLVKGRSLTESDNENAPGVVVINEAAARFFFKATDPVGRHLTYTLNKVKAVRTIVGVVKDVRDHSLKQEIYRRFYMPAFQPFDKPLGNVTLEVRTRAQPAAMGAALRAAVQSVDRSLPISDLQTLAVNLDDQMTQERLMAQLSAFFGLLALLLASLGLYGVMAYAMARRTGEIGIRMALGAKPESVVAMVLRETMVLVALGLAIGLPVALALTRLIASRLFGLQPWDPATIGVSVAVLVGVSVLAGYLSADIHNLSKEQVEQLEDDLFNLTHTGQRAGGLIFLT